MYILIFLLISIIVLLISNILLIKETVELKKFIQQIHTNLFGGAEDVTEKKVQNNSGGYDGNNNLNY